MSKGWIAIDGVSLTVVAVEPDRLSVCLIPETLERTTLGFKQVGDPVNLEFDGTAKVQPAVQQRSFSAQEAGHGHMHTGPHTSARMLMRSIRRLVTRVSPPRHPAQILVQTIERLVPSLVERYLAERRPA